MRAYIRACTHPAVGLGMNTQEAYAAFNEFMMKSAAESSTGNSTTSESSASAGSSTNVAPSRHQPSTTGAPARVSLTSSVVSPQDSAAPFSAATSDEGQGQCPLIRSALAPASGSGSASGCREELGVAPSSYAASYVTDGNGNEVLEDEGSDESNYGDDDFYYEGKSEP